MGVVNTVPEGLLDLLKAKTGGRNPTRMSEELRPTIALDEFYLAQALQTILLPNMLTTEGDARDVQVPPAQLWAIHSVHYQFTQSSSGQDVQLATGIKGLAPGAPSAVAWLDIGRTPSFTTPAGEVIYVARFESPVWLPAGAVLSSLVAESDTAGKTLTGNALTWRFDV